MSLPHLSFFIHHFCVPVKSTQHQSNNKNNCYTPLGPHRPSYFYLFIYSTHSTNLFFLFLPFLSSSPSIHSFTLSLIHSFSLSLIHSFSLSLSLPPSSFPLPFSLPSLSLFFISLSLSLSLSLCLSLSLSVSLSVSLSQ
ncbi:hypothetical protein BKA57DRAFT_114078 [Linnemannia elongata]|nr:hypothetical protein BKA57DRAFT_114078 [Linnemannia elongata]